MYRCLGTPCSNYPNSFTGVIYNANIQKTSQFFASKEMWKKPNKIPFPFTVLGYSETLFKIIRFHKCVEFKIIYSFIQRIKMFLINVPCIFKGWRTWLKIKSIPWLCNANVMKVTQMITLKLEKMIIRFSHYKSKEKILFSILILIWIKRN